MKQDVLRRANFAERIATILCELTPEEGRVFAIRGSWGHGKTSLKNLVVEQLSTRKGAAGWIEFNPWQWGDSQTITTALFKQIADKLGGGLSAEESERAAKLRRYGSMLAGTRDPLKKISGNSQSVSQVLANASVISIATSVGFQLPSAATIAALLAAASVGVPLLGKLLEHLGRDHWAEPLDKIRGSLEQSLRKLKTPLVVFVDDIDRLEPEQIRTLIRQIKVNANLPNIVFVLLFQPSIVEAALDPIANGQGQAFLQKIVQAHFDLPAVPAPLIHAAMSEELSRMAGSYATAENGFEEVRWGNMLVGFIQPMVSNLRGSRRFLSSVAIHLPLHAGSKIFEVNIIDFLCFEAIRVFLPQVYGAIADERTLLQADRFERDGLDDEHRSRLEKLLELAPPSQREILKFALKELFPQTRWVYGGSQHHLKDWAMTWVKSKRVCTPRFFPRYFELQTPVGELSESDFASFIHASGDKKALEAQLSELTSRDLDQALAFRLDEGVERLPLENAHRLLPVIFRLAQQLVEHRNAGPFNSPWVSAWRAASHLIGRLEPCDRGTRALEALRETGALSVAAILINLSDEKLASSEEPTLDGESVAALKSEWLSKIQALAVEPKRLLAEPDLGSLLYRWRDFSGGLEAPRTWVARAEKTDRRFAVLIERLMTKGTSHSVGDLVSSQVDSFQRQTIEDFIGLENARQRMSRFRMEVLTEEQAHAMAVLKRDLQTWPDRTDVES